MPSQVVQPASDRYDRRRDELQKIILEWDPLGIRGVAAQEYDPLVDPVLRCLSEGHDDAVSIESVLRRGVLGMARAGYSANRAESKSQSQALEPIVRRIMNWWQSAPPVS